MIAGSPITLKIFYSKTHILFASKIGSGTGSLTRLNWL